MNRNIRLHTISNNREKIGGNHYDREGKKRLLHRMQERDRVFFTEEGHRKEYKG